MVEDVSVILKVVICSYKAISDNEYRLFEVNIVPSSQCIPVSQLNEENYKLFEQGGGLNDTVEERWSNGSAAKARVLRAVEQMEAEKEGEAENGEPEVTDLAPHPNAESQTVAVVLGISNVVHAPCSHLPPTEMEATKRERPNGGGAFFELDR